MVQFPQLDLSLFFQGLGVVILGLASVWAARKVIKLINRS